MKPRPRTAVSPYSRKVQDKPMVPGNGGGSVGLGTANRLAPGHVPKVSSPKEASPDGQFAE